MCSIAAASLAFTALGTASTVLGQQQQAKAQKAQYAYQAAVARRNQDIANQYAEQATKEGDIEAKQRRQIASRAIGSSRVGAAAHGVAVGTGSALDLELDIARAGELDARQIERNAEKVAMGYRTKGLDFQSSAELAGLKADSVSSGALGTVLAGAGKVTQRYLELDELGAFG